jgi:glycerol-3-phosphate acyltransferase PlsY
MYYLVILLGAAAGYLSGSVSYARIFTRLGKGADITKLGNGNPGTSNVMREVGKGWGTLTLLGDALKGALVMALLKYLFFSSSPVFPLELPFDGAGYAGMVVAGIATIYGHAYPLFYKFRGGGSIGVLFGCWLLLVYPQFLICMVLSYIFVKIFLAKQPYPMGRMTPVVFLVLTPLAVLAESLIARDLILLHPGSLLFDHIGLGNHFLMFGGNGWIYVASIFLFTLAVVPPNLTLIRREILQGAPGPRS